MEGDKEAYLEEATKALKRQRKTIEDLEKEKKDLSRSLKSARSRKNNRKDGENAAKLARLAEEQVRSNLERIIGRFQCRERTIPNRLRQSTRMAACTKIKIKLKLMNFIDVCFIHQENLISAIDKEKSAISEMDTEIRRLERKIKSQLQPPSSAATADSTGRVNFDQLALE